MQKPITKEQIRKAEDQIYELRKSVKYDIRELTMEIIVGKYDKGIEYDEDENNKDSSKFYNTIFIPDYQRDFTWDEVRQSRFIESVILGLPVPLVFVAENKDSAWEIVDGSQRIRTLHAFIHNNLRLSKLEKLNELNDFYFDDLDKSRRGKFLATAMRMIVLSEDADDEVKKDMFERINLGSDLLKPMEKRKGIYIGFFRDFIYNVCANKQLLKELAPLDDWLQKRQELEELSLRYFALMDNNNYAHYPNETGIAKYLNNYLDKKNKETNEIIKQRFKKDYNDLNESEKKEAFKFLRQEYLKPYEMDFEQMLQFVKRYSMYGFRRTNNPQTKRVLFEALSVGVHLALKKKPNLEFDKEKMFDILNSEEYKKYVIGNVKQTRAYEPKRIRERIEFIRDNLINNAGR